MKQNPLNIAISLIFSLNLLEENIEYNINEIKSLSKISQHWITVQKYLNIFNLIQKYSPKIDFYGSKLKIIDSKIYKRLSEKQKFILYLYNNHALTEDTAIELGDIFDIMKIAESIGNLYEKTESDKYFLTKSGLNIYRLIKHNISEMISNKREIEEIFGEEEVQVEELRQFDSFIRELFERTSEFQYTETALPIPVPLESSIKTSSDTLALVKSPDLTEGI